MRSRAANSFCILCISIRSLVDAGCPAKQRWTGLPISASHSTSSQQLPSLRSDFPNIPTHFPHALLTAALTYCTSVVCFGAYADVLVQEPVVSTSHLYLSSTTNWKRSHGSSPAKAITHAAHQCLPVSCCCKVPNPVLLESWRQFHSCMYSH